MLQPHRIGAMVNNLQHAVVLEQLPTGIEADDLNDAFLLAMAHAGEAKADKDVGRLTLTTGASD